LRCAARWRRWRRGGGGERAWIGIDDGYAAAFAALLAFEDTSGRVFLVAERYGPGMTERMRLGAVRELVQIANAFDVPIYFLKIIYVSQTDRKSYLLDLENFCGKLDPPRHYP
jgi:hypothetical protein